MSLAFNDTNNLRGLVQLYEREVGFNRGDVSGNTNRLKEFVTDSNLAWDDYLAIALPASGTWQYDDSSHTKYPVIYADLVDGQRDYTFTTDEQGNLILDIYKVMVLSSATATTYDEVRYLDQQQTDAFESGDDIARESAIEGVPDGYDRTANGIFLDPTPSYNATNGLKVFINREANYFTTSDKTKKPGCPGLHHAYFYLRPALDYARRNNLANERQLKERVLELEQSIEEYFSRRSKDERIVFSPEPIIYE